MKKIALVIVLCMVGGTAYAAGKKKMAPAPAAPAAPAPVQAPMSSEATPQMSPSQAKLVEAQQQAMMQKMMQLGAPGEDHKVLQQLAGAWNYEGEMRMSPDAAPQSMKGTAVHTMVLGGRFLKQEVSGPPMMEGMPAFEGMGFTGYDNIRGEYQTVWLDNMMTGIMTGKGRPAAASGTITNEGTMSCPMTGERDRWFRDEWKIVDSHHAVLSSYTKGPDGKEFKGMEMRYTRAQ